MITTMNDKTLAAALQNGDFVAAQSAIEEYGHQVEVALHSAAGTAARAAVYQESLSTLSQHLHLARVLRAHVAAQIQGNAGSCLYEPAEADRHCWQFEG